MHILAAPNSSSYKLLKIFGCDIFYYFVWKRKHMWPLPMHDRPCIYYFVRWCICNNAKC